MSAFRLGIVGAGFWARFQIAGWQELDEVELVAITNRTRNRAESLAAEFGINAVTDTIEEMLETYELDAVDIITAPDTHATLAQVAIAAGVPVICQKPLADQLGDAETMVTTARASSVPLLVHENFRWQMPIRALKHALDSGMVGEPFRARISFCSAFPVFDNQPFLRSLERFLLMDVGTHILDVARFLFGDADEVYCRTSRVNKSIAGEDVATVILSQGPVTSLCEMSYASRFPKEVFPQTLISVEASHGTLVLEPDYRLLITTEAGTQSVSCAPHRYAWVDPTYAVVQAAIVDCNRNLRDSLNGEAAETTGEDNLRTLQLVDAAYQSAGTGVAVSLQREEAPL